MLTRSVEMTEEHQAEEFFIYFFFRAANKIYLLYLVTVQGLLSKLKHIKMSLNSSVSQ